MHHALLAETHFVLGGVNIHIHHGWIQFQKQHIGWMAAMIKHIRVSLTHRMANHLVADDPTIYIEIL